MKLLVLLFMLFSSVYAENRTWQNFNGFQYSIEMTPVNSYDEAEMECSALQATVANVKTIEIFKFLKRFLLREDAFYWLYIGAKRIENTSKFEWSDGSKLSVPTSIWGKGQPNHPTSEENCVVILNTANGQEMRCEWFDAPCAFPTAGYICQKFIAGVEPASSTTLTINLTTDTTLAKSISTNNTVQVEIKVDKIILFTCGGFASGLFCTVVVFLIIHRRKTRNEIAVRVENESVYVDMTGNRQIAGTHNNPSVHTEHFGNHVTTQSKLQQQQQQQQQQHNRVITLTTTVDSVM